MAKSQVIGTEELLAKFEALDEGVQGTVLEKATMAGALVIVNAAKKNVKDQGLILTRTLSRSIHIGGHSEDGASDVGGAVVGNTRVELLVGTNLVYAAVHEHGGVIKPKKGKYLAIPVGSYRGSPRDHADLRIRKSGSDSLVLVDAGGTVQYVLKTSVTIPAKPYLRPAYDDNQKEAQDEIGRAILKQIEKAAS